MMKQLLIATMFMVVLTGCKSKSAFNYSETVVTKERSLGSDIRETEEKVGRFVQAGKYDSVAIAGEKMEKKVQEKIDEIDALALPDAKGSADFKTAVLGYFRYIKSIYTEYKGLGRAETQEQRDREIKNIQDIVTEKTTVLNNMKKAQEKFAKDNGFKTQ
jgi:hypothetical protein